MPWKKYSEVPSTSIPVNGLALSQVTQHWQLQFPTNSRSKSHSQSAQQTQRSQPICPWSAHTPPSVQWPSPFPRHSHAPSTTATAGGELFLFGGNAHGRICNDLYVISTQDFSTSLLQASGDVPDPRYGHRAMFTSTSFLIWGGARNVSDQIKQNQVHDDSLYLLNLVSREWTRVVVNGPGPGGRYYHTMTLVGSKLFVFGGWTAERALNDIWELDLDLRSNPRWEICEPSSGNKKPLPRAAHVSVTTGDRIVIFGGAGRHCYNDTWSFDITTRKWTELRCTGSVPFARASHAAVLVGDIMYVFGGRTIDGTYLGDLAALNLSTQRWIAFQDIGPSPCGRFGHDMACDGTRVFVLGGLLSPGAQADETKLIHVLDTKYLDYPEPDSNAINPSEKTTQLVRKSPASHPTRGQPYQPSSSSNIHAAHGASPFQKATPKGLVYPTSQQITRKNPSLNGLLLRPTCASGGLVPEEDDDSKGATGNHAKLVGPGAPSWKEFARPEDGRLIELKRQLLGTLVAKFERDQRIAQLTDQLEQAEANAAEEKKRAGLELRELQAKFDESLLSRDHALEQTQSALQQSQRELTEMRAELEARKSESAAFRLRLPDRENNYEKSKAEAVTYRTQTAMGFVDTDESRAVHRLMERLMERVQAVEAEIASLRRNEKSFEKMECRNEG